MGLSFALAGGMFLAVCASVVLSRFATTTADADALYYVGTVCACGFWAALALGCACAVYNAGR